MRIQVLGCHGGESLDARMTCLLIEDSIALDAGSLTEALSIERQVGVRSILLTHSHMDHTNSLPFFVENVYGKTQDAIDLYASPPTIYALRKHLFNNATWPDFSRLPNHLLPALRFHELEDEVPVEIDGVRFTPIPVNHLIPTHGFLIEKNGATILWSSDTGPTTRLWEIANGRSDLQAVWLETSFSNALQEIADVSCHLTPQTLEQELEKLQRPVPVLLHHLKPSYIQQIHEEVRALGRPDLDFLEQGKTYEF